MAADSDNEMRDFTQTFSISMLRHRYLCSGYQYLCSDIQISMLYLSPSLNLGTTIRKLVGKKVGIVFYRSYLATMLFILVFPVQANI